MGAWGIGSFDNDDALDWIQELSRSGTKAIAAALNAITAAGEDYKEAPEASMAIAACEVVAAMRSRPATELPPGVIEFLRGGGQPDDAILENARVAIRRILGDSELEQLWRPSPDYRKWRALLEDLLRRLA